MPNIISLKQLWLTYFKICGLTNVNTSCNNFIKLPNTNVDPNVLTNAGKIEACFFLVPLVNSTESGLYDA